MMENFYTSDNSKDMNSSSDNSSDQSQNLAAILSNMSVKLEGISRLERKLEEVTVNFHGDLDILKMELANIAEARKQDGVEINKIQN